MATKKTAKKRPIKKKSVTSKKKASKKKVSRVKATLPASSEFITKTDLAQAIKGLEARQIARFDAFSEDFSTINDLLSTLINTTISNAEATNGFQNDTHSRLINYEMVLGSLSGEIQAANESITKGLGSVAELVSLSLGKYAEGQAVVDKRLNTLSGQFEGTEQLIAIMDPILIQLTRISAAFEAGVEPDEDDSA